MSTEHSNEIFTTENGKTIEIKQGGNILTNKLIFERPDLLSQCPIEIQQAIKLYHVGEELLSQGKYEEGRKLIEEAVNSIPNHPNS